MIAAPTRRRPGRSFRGAAWCALGITATRAFCAEPHASQPYLAYREQTLEYHGPESEPANLTEMRIGWFGPHETNSRLGDPWRAATLAVREANASGGYRGLSFRLVPRWAADPWGSGVSQLARMVYDEQPLALMGSIDSAATHLAEQVVAKANLPLVSPVATDKSATLAGVSWIFACAPADDAIARSLAADLGGLLRPETDKLAVLVCTDHESRVLGRELMRELRRLGRSPDFRFDVPAGAADFTSQMALLEQARPRAVILLAGMEDAARLIAATRAILPDATIYGGPSIGRAGLPELAGPAAEGVRYPVLFSAENEDSPAAAFVRRFAGEYGHTPDYTAALAYDATRLLIQAIRQAGPHRARIRESLRQLSPWPGVAGPIGFDGTGQNTRSDIRIRALGNQPRPDPGPPPSEPAPNQDPTP